MNQKKSEFDKVFSAWDILVIAFGAMIGWGWVVSSGVWIQKGGVIGAALGFAIGGIMIFFVGLTYICGAYGSNATVRRRACIQLQGDGVDGVIYMYMGHSPWICRSCML